MSMYETSDFRKGLKLEIEGVPFVMVDFQHVKPGKGNQFTRVKIRNMLTGNVIERTWKSGEKFNKANLEEKDVQYLYKEEDGFVFMNQTDYDQFKLTVQQVADDADYLVEQMELSILFFDGKAIAINLPNFIESEITQCDPAVKGDTVTGGSKPATVKTGLSVQVPYHIKEGDIIKIDTRTGKYVEKINK